MHCHRWREFKNKIGGEWDGTFVHLYLRVMFRNGFDRSNLRNRVRKIQQQSTHQVSLTSESNLRLKTEICASYTTTCSIARVIRKNKTHGPPKPTQECSLSHKHKNHNPNNAHHPLNLTCLVPYIHIGRHLCIVFAQYNSLLNLSSLFQLFSIILFTFVERFSSKIF